MNLPVKSHLSPQTRGFKMNVYQVINKVMADINKTGIAKGRKNLQQNYAFRGIDDVYNALSSSMAAHGLVVLPRVLSRDVTERTTKSGTSLFYVVVEVEFDFVSSEDGSKHVVRTIGEAMDSADKATNKAMSAAYKYAALQTFCIPTEGDNDSENDNHEATLSVAMTEDAMIYVAQIQACEDMKTLGEVWAEIPADIKKLVAKAKDAKKAELSK